MFNRSERNILQELSLQVLGSASAYQKLIKDPKFQIIIGFRDVVEDFYYDYVPSKQLKNGKQKFTAIRRTYPKNEPIPAKKIPITREMTFDEIRTALIAASEMKGFQSLYDTDEIVFYETLVSKYLDGTILNKPFLHITEADRPEFDKDFENLPQSQQDVLKPYITQNSPRSGIFMVDGCKFLNELIYKNLNNEETIDTSLSL